MTVREFRNRGGAIVDRVVAGERITITRNGEPVAQLERIRRRLTAAELLNRWRHLPSVNAAMLHADIGTMLIRDPDLPIASRPPRRR